MVGRLSHDLILSGGAKDHHDLKTARARFAYQEVSNWQPDNVRRDATTEAQGLPIQVRTQGLLVTLAVLTSRRDTVSDLFADALTLWLLKDAPHQPLGSWSGPGTERPTALNLLKTLTDASRADHAAAQREAVLLLDQIKIFAKALHGQATEDTP